MTNLPSLDTINQAARTIYATMPPTPQFVWPLLQQAFGAAPGTEIWIKHENHTPTGAFKLRGVLTLFEHLAESRIRCAGVIGASKGNHGQAMGFAARRSGLRCVVVVPPGNSKEKNAAMRALGVELIEYGQDFQDAREHAAHLSAAEDLQIVPTFHQHLLSGVATYWAEFFRAAPNLEIVYVPIGQGSGINACIAARNTLSPRTKIVGVVSAHAPCFALSFAAGKVVEAEASTQIADGLACRKPDAESFDIIAREVERVIQVTDAEVAAAMRLLFSATHNVAEGAGAASLAGALQERAQLAGRKVGITLCGGNVDSDVFSRVLAGESFDSPPLQRQ